MKNKSIAFGLLLFGSSIFLTAAVKFGNPIPFFFMNSRNKRLRNQKDDKDVSDESAGRLIMLNPQDNSENWKKEIKYSSEIEIENSDCEFQIVNNFDETVLICWVEPNGSLRNYYPINDGSIKDGSVTNKRLEFTFVGHTFVMIRVSEPLPKAVKDIKKENLLLAYTPLKAKHRHSLVLNKATPVPSSLRQKAPSVEVICKCVPIIYDEDDKIIETANKPYLCKTICGFTVNFEEGVFEHCPTLECALSEDLTQLNTLMPLSASAKLQEGTPMWINKSLTYGTTKKPIEGIIP